MRLNCPKCASEIAAVDVNIRQMVAACRRCDNVFGFQSLVPDVRKDLRPTVRPDHITITLTDKQLSLSWRWLRNETWLALVGGVLCAWWATYAVFDGMFIGLFYFPIAVGLLYFALIGFINSSRIHVTHKMLQVLHGPLPWRENQDWPVERIKQLYTAEYRKGPYYEQFFATMVILDGGRHRAVAEKLKSAEHALYIEQQIESFLGIADERVKGELQQ